MIKSFEYIILFFGLVLVIMLMCGCSKYPKEVLIPIKCNIDERHRPALNNGIVENVKDLLIYTESLEQDLNFCRGVSDG